jgi:hypothetical protein
MAQTPSENQRQDADHDRQADEEDNANCAAENFEHFVSFCCV